MNSPDHIGRRRPAQSYGVGAGERRIEYVTVGTKRARSWLACDKAHLALLHAWEAADAWLVGRYVVMPDHVHFFCAPAKEISLDVWIVYWKRVFSQCANEPEWKWLSRQWDTRIRNAEDYREKWLYLQQNPVARGLVKQSEDWPHQGELNELRW